MNHIWTAENEVKWRYDRRSETQFKQLRKEAWKKKIQDFNGVWTRDLAIPVRCSTNWAMKPLTLGAGQLWVHMFPWKKWVLMIYEWIIYELRKMKWNEGMIVAVKRNLSNCVKKPEKKKKFRTSTGFEPVTSRYRCDALPTELKRTMALWSPKGRENLCMHFLDSATDTSK